MGQNERFFVFLSSSIGKMEAKKIAESFLCVKIEFEEKRALFGVGRGA